MRTGSRIRFVDVNDVDWIGGAGNYVILHVAGSEHRVRGSLKGFAAKLDAPAVSFASTTRTSSTSSAYGSYSPGAMASSS